MISTNSIKARLYIFNLKKNLNAILMNVSELRDSNVRRIYEYKIILF